MTAKEPDVASEVAGDQEALLALVGSRIRAARQRAGLKQSEVAKAIGTKQSYMVGVEVGLNNTSLRNLGRIADALGVPVVSFFLEKEPLSDDAVAQIQEVVFIAIQENERLSSLLKRVQDLAAGKPDGPDADAPV